MPPKRTSKDGLANEAATMELKLLELRKAMEKERAKREAMMGAGGQQSIWRNGGAGLLRNNYKTKQTSQGSGAAPTASGSSTQSIGTADGTSVRKASTAETEEPMPSVSGVRAPSGMQAGSAGRRAEVLTLEDDDGGMGVGTEGDCNLMDGGFSEGDSHRSFLEALEEWRRANRTGGEAEVAEVAAAPSTSGRVSGHVGAEMEVQTDTARTQASAPGRPNLFNKLIISTAARHAGALAGGVTPGSSNALLPNAAGLRASTSSLRASQALYTLADFNNDDDLHLGSAEGALGGSTAGTPKVHDPFAILEKLEELEILAEARARAQADDYDDIAITSVTTEQGLVLTKKTRLPDAVLLPQNDS